MLLCLILRGLDVLLGACEVGCLSGRIADVTSCDGGVLGVRAFFGVFWVYGCILVLRVCRVPKCLVFGLFCVIEDLVTGGCNCDMVCFAGYLRVGGFRMLVCLPVLVWLRFDFWGLCSMPFVVFLDLVAGCMDWLPSSVACV